MSALDVDPLAPVAVGQECRRWDGRVARHRPSGEVLDPSRYRVQVVERRATASAFVETHHYSGTFPASVLNVGLYRVFDAFPYSELVGVAAFSVPMAESVIPKWTGLPSPSAARIQEAVKVTEAAARIADPRLRSQAIRDAQASALHGLELGRFIMLPDVPGNGESWFLSRALHILKHERPTCGAVISASDPLVRRYADGSVRCPGHVGVIYQALNGQHVGYTGSHYIHLDRQMRTISARAISKVKAQDQGAAYSERQLVDAGCDPRRPGEDPADWLERVLPALPRVKHPGCIMYRWALGKVALNTLPPLPYPRTATHRVEAEAGAPIKLAKRQPRADVAPVLPVGAQTSLLGALNA